MFGARSGELPHYLLPYRGDAVMVAGSGDQLADLPLLVIGQCGMPLRGGH